MSSLPNKKFYIEDESWAKELENGILQYTDSLIESAFEEDAPEVPTLSGEPFCGCDTCFWRETLFYVVPRIIEGYKAGKVVVDED